MPQPRRGVALKGIKPAFLVVNGYRVYTWHLRFELLDRSLRREFILDWSTALRIPSHTVLPLEPR
jgi:hypothetical protein